MNIGWKYGESGVMKPLTEKLYDGEPGCRREDKKLVPFLLLD